MSDIIISINSWDVEALELAIDLIKEKDELKKKDCMFFQIKKLKNKIVTELNN